MQKHNIIPWYIFGSAVLYQPEYVETVVHDLSTELRPVAGGVSDITLDQMNVLYSMPAFGHWTCTRLYLMLGNWDTLALSLTAKVTKKQQGQTHLLHRRYTIFLGFSWMLHLQPLCLTNIWFKYNTRQPMWFFNAKN